MNTPSQRSTMRSTPSRAEPIENPAPTGDLPGVYGQQPNRGVLGCALVPVLFCALVFGGATLFVAGLLAYGALFAAKQAPLGVALGTFATCAVFALFFGMVARRLIAALRGREVPHLLPPLVALITSGVLGLACVVAGLSAIFSSRGGYGAGQSVGVGVVFIAYAVQRYRALARKPREGGAA